MRRWDQQGLQTRDVRRVRRWSALRVSVVIAVGTILANAALYLAYRGMSLRPSANEQPAVLEGTKTVSEGRSVARVLRRAGLEALERGEFALAYDRFLAARKMPDPSPDIEGLLRVAQGLRDKTPLKLQASARAFATDAPPKVKGNSTKQRAARDASLDRKLNARSVPTLAAVTIHPAGLPARSDGRVEAPSPTRVEGRSGTRAIEIFQSEKRLIRRRVSATGVEVSHVNVDLAKSFPSEAKEQTGLGQISSLNRPLAGDDAARDALEEPGQVGALAASEVAWEMAGVDDELASPRAVVPAKLKERAKVPANVLSQVVDRQGRRIRSCYTAQLRRQLGMEGGLAGGGRVVIHLVVSPDGVVQEGRIQKSTLDNAHVDGCIEDVVRKLKFPALRQTSEVTFVMRFGQDG